MNQRPTIALLIPAYNAAAFLPRLLKSAAAQVPAFHEIWIHDDCSTDDTAAVGRSCGANVFTNEKNVGCTGGKARLLTLTNCDWVHFHDADDELLPGFTAAARTIIEHDPNVDALITGTEELSDVDPNHCAVGIPDRQLLRADPLLFSINYKVNAICGIYRRSFLLNNDTLTISEDERYNEDQAIQLNLVSAGASFDCIPEVLVRSYKQVSSMSQSNAARCARAHMNVVLRALRVEYKPDTKAALQKAVAERLWGVVATAAANGDVHTADEAASHAVRLSTIPSTAGGKAFRALAQIHPPSAIRFREFFIRTMKPSLRTVK